VRRRALAEHGRQAVDHERLVLLLQRRSPLAHLLHRRLPLRARESLLHQHVPRVTRQAVVLDEAFHLRAQRRRRIPRRSRRRRQRRRRRAASRRERQGWNEQQGGPHAVTSTRTACHPFHSHPPGDQSGTFGWTLPAPSVARARSTCVPAGSDSEARKSCARPAPGSPSRDAGENVAPPSALTSTFATGATPENAIPTTAMGSPARSAAPSDGRAITDFTGNAVAGMSSSGFTAAPVATGAFSTR